jgi:hypothetical protein
VNAADSRRGDGTGPGMASAHAKKKDDLLCRANLGEDTGIDAHRTMDTKMRSTANSVFLPSKYVQGGVRVGPDGHSQVARRYGSALRHGS